MEAYKIIDVIGDGSFGTVMKAQVIKTGEIVAIKKMKKKFNSWDECMALRELKSLRKLNHFNLIKLKEALKVKDELYFVFEYMEQNVYQLYMQFKDSGKSLNENQIKTIMYHTTSGLAYMHKHGFFHRDLKPENLLIAKGVTKIADLGLAREIRSRPPFTDYVATRWYRAPEILLKAPNYNSPVDIFALGCIMAELYLQAPLFKGNTEMEQMYKICSILGAPTTSSWNEGIRLAAQVGFNFPQLSPTNLSNVIPNASDDAIQLISEMIRFDSQKRPSAMQVLQHPYFDNFLPSETDILSLPFFNTLSTPPCGKRNLHGSAEERTIKRKPDFGAVKYNDINVDDHLDILDKLDQMDMEGSLGKEDNEKDFYRKKEEPVKPRDSREPKIREDKLSQDDITDDLLAEIEQAVNSGANSSTYQPNPKILTTQFGGSKVPIGNQSSRTSAIGEMYSQLESYDKNPFIPGQMGPSTYDILSKGSTNVGGGNTYGRTNQYPVNIPTSNDNMYKYGGGNNYNNQWNAPSTNISNKGNQILNSFVYSNTKTQPGIGNAGIKPNAYGAGLNDDPESFAKYGY